MTAASHPAPTRVLSTAAPGFLAADVGGTHVRVARVEASGDAAHPVRVLDYRKYRNADHPGLGAILSDFLGDGMRPAHCVVATAGYAREDGTVITANVPWPLSARQVEADVGLQRVFIVNDFEAVAYAAAQVDASGVLHLCGPDSAPRGPTLVVGPGTGLGAAVWIPTAHGAVVLATVSARLGLASLAADSADARTLATRALATLDAQTYGKRDPRLLVLRVEAQGLHLHALEGGHPRGGLAAR